MTFQIGFVPRSHSHQTNPSDRVSQQEDDETIDMSSFDPQSDDEIDSTGWGDASQPANTRNEQQPATTDEALTGRLSLGLTALTWGAYCVGVVNLPAALVVNVVVQRALPYLQVPSDTSLEMAREMANRAVDKVSTSPYAMTGIAVAAYAAGWIPASLFMFTALTIGGGVKKAISNTVGSTVYTAGLVAGKATKSADKVRKTVEDQQEGAGSVWDFIAETYYEAAGDKVALKESKLQAKKAKLEKKYQKDLAKEEKRHQALKALLGKAAYDKVVPLLNKTAVQTVKKTQEIDVHVAKVKKQLEDIGLTPQEIAGIERFIREDAQQKVDPKKAQEVAVTKLPDSLREKIAKATGSEDIVSARQALNKVKADSKKKVQEYVETAIKELKVRKPHMSASKIRDNKNKFEKIAKEAVKKDFAVPKMAAELYRDYCKDPEKLIQRLIENGSIRFISPLSSEVKQSMVENDLQGKSEAAQKAYFTKCAKYMVNRPNGALAKIQGAFSSFTELVTSFPTSNRSFEAPAPESVGQPASAPSTVAPIPTVVDPSAPPESVTGQPASAPSTVAPIPTVVNPSAPPESVTGQPVVTQSATQGYYWERGFDTSAASAPPTVAPLPTVVPEATRPTRLAAYNHNHR